ncbi:hypothetical protein C0V73_09770 [Rhizobium sp. TH135]|uniref:hypothetical protein n=1 Tax=Rhizobium sp. TH135 TaxID=2067451 RepID=UPI000CB6267B|nr:hypothetical protein [Rhizobium sp. TH135]PLK70906.1 hypothetical protein C0V73_09770 [Rhizobium sp. TH135]
MTTLSRAPNGDWFARKAIPKDIREEYKSAYGVSQEERFRRPAAMSANAAKAELRDWDATIAQRIEKLRAVNSGAVLDLTPRQISALCGEWYSWFTSSREEDPGSPETWESFHERLMSAYDGIAGTEDIEDIDSIPMVKRRVHARVLEIGEVASFLAEKQTRLSPTAMDAFLSAVKTDLVAALALLRRRAGGDYSPDERLSRFGNSVSFEVGARKKKLAGQDSWQAFSAWVKERNPAPATVTRWRSVFMNLNDHFDKRDVALITADDAVAWKDTLLTEDRSARVVNEVWIRSVVTVFNWLVTNKKLDKNPFSGVRVAAGKKMKRRERAFRADEWKAILRATLDPNLTRVKADKAAARRWVPWLCAYTGSRPGEMTQLHGSSVYREDGHWIIEITPDDGSVKGSSWRKVPIHEHLIEQGFLDFVRGKGQGPLFYDPNEKRRESTDPLKPVRAPHVIVRQKLGEWVRQDVGVTDPDISPNHAWRHTFKRIAARAGIERRFRFAYCGHETDEVGDIYEIPTLDDMAKELTKFPRYDLTEEAEAQDSEPVEELYLDPDEASASG